MIIGHYESDIWAAGGLAAYIRRIGQAQRSLGHTVYYFSQNASVGIENEQVQPILVSSEPDLYDQAKRLKLDILHVHGEVTTIPPRQFATVRTLQGHQPYCPSASKFLKQSNQPCNRSYSVLGCLQGHLLDRCGSIRPNQLIQNFQAIAKIRPVLSQMPVIVVSQFLKDRLVEVGYDASSIHVLHLFAPKVFQPSSPPTVGVPRFVFLGRFTPEKGLSWLFNAIAQVSVPIHLDVAGQGNQAAQIQQQIDTLGLCDRVTLHGWLNEAQTEQLIAQARAVVYPSLWHEPGGTVAFEAMAQARALIMSRVGGMPEVVRDGVNGLLVEPNDVVQLAHSLERLAKDWQLAKQLGETGQAYAIEQFSLDHHLTQLMHIYQQNVRSTQESLSCI
ncbi:glycosyltransferase family 4 protein [Leptolyngbya sp. NIES-2104]|uniref:glycosyltransferase family 4 protein n=1 Tax=Leptolyngbya sp. NIES-2104 TaxID=1552121 RepID=UPI0006EC67BA|nr:glycosyltransferase family 4 protein [Leptolyngbya sp. NIES-2104]GAP95135.1 glycosyltransferase [Leptolyngbya sp. NIES-2104]